MTARETDIRCMIWAIQGKNPRITVVYRDVRVILWSNHSRILRPLSASFGVFSATIPRIFEVTFNIVVRKYFKIKILSPSSGSSA